MHCYCVFSQVQHQGKLTLRISSFQCCALTLKGCFWENFKIADRNAPIKHYLLCSFSSKRDPNKGQSAGILTKQCLSVYGWFKSTNRQATKAEGAGRGTSKNKGKIQKLNWKHIRMAQGTRARIQKEHKQQVQMTWRQKKGKLMDQIHKKLTNYWWTGDRKHTKTGSKPKHDRWGEWTFNIKQEITKVKPQIIKLNVFRKRVLGSY